jgi:hypothetical protein
MPTWSGSEPLDAPTTQIDSSTTEGFIPEDSVSHRWPLLERIWFRFALCYFGGSCIFSGNATVWQAIPYLGHTIELVLAGVFALPAQYLAEHVFFVPPPGNHLHPTGSGDTAINWICVLLLLVLSAVATAVWSVLDRRRPHYQTLAAWLRFLIRLTLGVGMVTYGLSKVIPTQMSQPSISALSEPLGMHSPMALLWNFIGLNPWYESVCGAAELLAGLMILFRRTALAGALLTAFVASNVLLYNLFFDVPVKLYSGHLLLLSLFVILPDARALFRFFWQHQPAAPTGVWVPPATRPWFRRATIAIEVVFVVLVLGNNLYYLIPSWHERRVKAAAKCDLCSAWWVENESVDASTTYLPSPFPGVVSELVIDSPTSAVLRDPTYKPSYVRIEINEAA